MRESKLTSRVRWSSTRESCLNSRSFISTWSLYEDTSFENEHVNCGTIVSKLRDSLSTTLETRWQWMSKSFDRVQVPRNRWFTRHSKSREDNEKRLMSWKEKYLLSKVGTMFRTLNSHQKSSEHFRRSGQVKAETFLRPCICLARSRDQSELSPRRWSRAIDLTWLTPFQRALPRQI